MNTDLTPFDNAFTCLLHRPEKGQMVSACGVPGEQVRIKMGETEDTIVEVARELDADMAVIGYSGRSGLTALINTNTAEKILDKPDCNLPALP